MRCDGAAGRIGFQCGTVTVPLDRSGAVPGAVSLHVRRLPARAFASKPPLVALAGGPGQGATNFATAFAAAFEEALDDRDLVVVDQRGTGRSGALRCASFEGAIADEDALAAAMQACAGSLSGQLGLYRTLDSVEDLDAIRAEIGAERLALFGVSYGTKVALAYAARHPLRVDRLVLDSVVDLDGPDALWQSTFAAMPSVLREVCGRQCPFTRDPASDMAALVRRLDSPLQSHVVAPNGKRTSETLSKADLFGLLLAGDFDPWLRAELPGAVAGAANGDGAQLLRLLHDLLRATPEELPHEFSTPLYYATTCSDSAMPWSAGDSLEQRAARLRAQVAAVPAEQFAPFDAATALEVGIPWTCRHWPAPTAPPPGLGAVPDVPVLALNGTLDLRTPLAEAQALTAALPRARLIAVGGAGHSVVLGGPSCASTSAVAFLADRPISARPCRMPPFVLPERPAPSSLAAVGGTGRARVAAAVELTLRDVLHRLPLSTGSLGERFQLRGGGLRAGRYVARPNRLVLYGVEFVPGVTVSGSIGGNVDPLFGTVRRARGTLLARVGGTTVRVRVSRRVLSG